MSLVHTPYPAFISITDVVMLVREGGTRKTRRGSVVQLLGMGSTSPDLEVD
jgi:hypothetical protein